MCSCPRSTIGVGLVVLTRVFTVIAPRARGELRLRHARGDLRRAGLAGLTYSMILIGAAWVRERMLAVEERLRSPERRVAQRSGSLARAAAAAEPRGRRERQAAAAARLDAAAGRTGGRATTSRADAAQSASLPRTWMCGEWPGARRSAGRSATAGWLATAARTASVGSACRTPRRQTFVGLRRGRWSGPRERRGRRSARSAARRGRRGRAPARAASASARLALRRRLRSGPRLALRRRLRSGPRPALRRRLRSGPRRRSRRSFLGGDLLGQGFGGDGLFDDRGRLECDGLRLRRGGDGLGSGSGAAATGIGAGAIGASSSATAGAISARPTSWSAVASTGSAICSGAVASAAGSAATAAS